MAEQDNATPAAQPTGGNPAPTAADPASTATGGEAATPPTSSEPKWKPETPEQQAEVQRMIHNRVERERRARERAEAEADTLRKLIPQPKQPEAPTDSDPRPKQGDFEHWDDYQIALGQWGARQEFKTLRESERKQDQERQATEHATSVHQRYGAAIEEAETLNSGFRDGFDKLIRLPMSAATGDALQEAIAMSDRGADLLAHLAGNLAEAERIAKLSPFIAVKELGKLEASLPARQKVSVSQAPAPVNPGGGSGGAVVDDKAPTNSDDYRKWREKQLAAGRR